jgi:hypothetical protein
MIVPTGYGFGRRYDSAMPWQVFAAMLLLSRLGAVCWALAVATSATVAGHHAGVLSAKPKSSRAPRIARSVGVAFLTLLGILALGLAATVSTTAHWPFLVHRRH